VSTPVRAGTGVFSSSRARITARTLRTDRWWVPPLLTVVGLLAFVVYATTRAFWDAAFFVPEYGYLTPFYSPCIELSCGPAAHFGTLPFELPAILPKGFLALPFLLGFRLTCYYYRKAYYRAFWMSPPACAVAEPHQKYSGETRFPLIIQNAHRYFFYVAALVSVINTYDAALAFRGADGSFGIGLGSLILLTNVVLLWAYTLSCHSCRHITGGRLKHFSKHPVRYRIWTFVSKLNTRHMQLAWITLGTLVLTDFYVMLVASETISDLRIFN
jgi:hypothetical protein